MVFQRNTSHYVSYELPVGGVFSKGIALKRSLVLIVVGKELVVTKPAFITSGSSVVIEVRTSMGSSKGILPGSPSRHAVSLFFGECGKPVGGLAFEQGWQGLKQVVVAASSLRVDCRDLGDPQLDILSDFSFELRKVRSHGLVATRKGHLRLR
jgi:hypothetical protein